MVVFFAAMPRINATNQFRYIPLSLFFISLFIQFVCCTSKVSTIENDSSKQTSGIYEITCHEKRVEFSDELKRVSETEEIPVHFYKFETIDNFLQFLGLRYQKGSKKIYQISTKKFSIFLNALVSASKISKLKKVKSASSSSAEKHVQLTGFRMIIDSKVTELINEFTKSLKKEEIISLFKSIYCAYSSELKQKLSTEIKNKHPTLLHAKHLKANSILSIETIISIYKKKLSKMGYMNEDVNLLKSMIMTLFMERLSRHFTQILPSELKNLEIFIQAEIPTFYNLSNMFQHLSGLKQLLLGGTYFNEKDEKLLHFLSTSNIPKIRLEGSALIANFRGFIRKQSSNGNSPRLQKNSSPVEPKGDIFKELESLEYILLNESFRVEMFKGIENLPSMKSFKLVCSLKAFSLSFDNWINFANSTTLKEIILQLDFDKNSLFFIMSRDKGTEKFEKINFHVDGCIMYGIEGSKSAEQFDNSSNYENQLSNIIEVYFSNYKPLARKLSNQTPATAVLKWDIIATFKCIKAAFHCFRSQHSNSISTCIDESNMLLNTESFINEVERNTLKIFKNLSLDPRDAILYICERIIELENDDGNGIRDKKMKLLISLVDIIDDSYWEVSRIFSFEYKTVDEFIKYLNDKRKKVLN